MAGSFNRFLQDMSTQHKVPTTRAGEEALNRNVFGAGLAGVAGADAEKVIRAGILFVGARGATDDATNPGWRAHYGYDQSGTNPAISAAPAAQPAQMKNAVVWDKVPGVASAPKPPGMA